MWSVVVEVMVFTLTLFVLIPRWGGVMYRVADAFTMWNASRHREDGSGRKANRRHASHMGPLAISGWHWKRYPRGDCLGRDTTTGRALRGAFVRAPPGEGAITDSGSAILADQLGQPTHGEIRIGRQVVVNNVPVRRFVGDDEPTSFCRR
jgi:hypothetical protein